MVGATTINVPFNNTVRRGRRETGTATFAGGGAGNGDVSCLNQYRHHIQLQQQRHGFHRRGHIPTINGGLVTLSGVAENVVLSGRHTGR